MRKKERKGKKKKKNCKRGEKGKKKENNKRETKIRKTASDMDICRLTISASDATSQGNGSVSQLLSFSTPFLEDDSGERGGMGRRGRGEGAEWGVSWWAAARGEGGG